MRDVCIAILPSLPYAGIQKSHQPEMVWRDLCRHPLIQLYRRMA